MKHDSEQLSVLVVTYEFPPVGGGGAKVVAGLVDRLLQEGMSVDILTMGFRGSPWYEQRKNRRIFRIPSIRRDPSVCRVYEMIPHLLLALPVALWLAMRNRYRVNHTHFILPDGIISAVVKMITGLPVITTAHGSDVPGYNPNRFRLMHRVLRPMWRWLTSYTDAIICPSRFLHDLIKRQNPEANTVIIPNGIDIHRFDPDGPKEPKILCVTRMFERKGVQHLVTAVSSNALPGWKTTIVGDGPYLENLREMTPADAGIEFLGYIDNDSPRLRALYESTSIFVLASSAENFPIVLLEAMIAGAAIITTRGTGCQDVVGDAAILVEPDDPWQLAEALERLVNEPAYRAALGRKARSRAESLFSWEAVASQHRQLYLAHGRAREAETLSPSPRHRL